eukprot:scaffold17617_cov98-Isochrysis_galbana.AAC.1
MASAAPSVAGSSQQPRAPPLAGGEGKGPSPAHCSRLYAPTPSRESGRPHRTVCGTRWKRSGWTRAETDEPAGPPASDPAHTPGGPSSCTAASPSTMSTYRESWPRGVRPTRPRTRTKEPAEWGGAAPRKMSCSLHALTACVLALTLAARAAAAEAASGARRRSAKPVAPSARVARMTPVAESVSPTKSPLPSSACSRRSAASAAGVESTPDDGDMDSRQQGVHVHAESMFESRI